MVRYTTPTFQLTLPETVDLTEASNVYVTFSKASGTVIYTKSGEDIEVSAHQVDVYLTQSETAVFPTGAVRLQLNWTYQEGGEAKRACSEIASVNVTPNLLNEVVE